MRAVVVGGGLAGLAAALDLAEAGHDVTVLEARPTLGGAVQTLPVREGDPDPPPDNGQHIALGCCTEYLGFLERVGQAGAIRREALALPVIAEDGSVARIAPGALGLLRYGHVSLRDRLKIALVTRRLGRLAPEEHDGETFAGLLRRLGQSQAAIDRFWDVFIRPALNLRSEEVSAAPAVFTVQTALLGEPEASDVILPVAPLGEMHGEAAGRVLHERGATIRLGERAAALERGAVVLADGGRVEADVVVVALPPAESAALLGDPDPGLDDSPIVSAHLLFDRKILEFELAALLGSPAHWVFDRGALTGHRPADRPVPHGRLQRRARALGGARPRPRRPAGGRADGKARRCRARLVARQSRAGRDVRRLPGHGAAPTGGRDGAAGSRAGGRVDGHRLARDHGKRRSQRTCGGPLPPLLAAGENDCVRHLTDGAPLPTTRFPA